MSTTGSHHLEEREFNPTAAVLAWLWPGLGHIMMGHRRRGAFIMAGVLFLYVSGLLIGGIDCVDRKSDRLWFMAQVINGPIALATDMANQMYIKHLPDEQRDFAIALNKPNETGTLFCALAGLMNLIVILDALYPMPRPPESERPMVERRKAAA